jgi:hypothetical protein
MIASYGETSGFVPAPAADLETVTGGNVNTTVIKLLLDFILPKPKSK